MGQQVQLSKWSKVTVPHAQLSTATIDCPPRALSAAWIIGNSPTFAGGDDADQLIALDHGQGVTVALLQASKDRLGHLRGVGSLELPLHDLGDGVS